MPTRPAKGPVSGGHPGSGEEAGGAGEGSQHHQPGGGGEEQGTQVLSDKELKEEHKMPKT